MSFANFHVYAAGAAVSQVEVVAELYAEAFFDPPHNQGQVELDRMTDAWPRRLEAPGFRLVIAEYAGQPIGCIYGHQLLPGTKWWDGALEPLSGGSSRSRTRRGSRRWSRCQGADEGLDYGD